MRRRSIGRRLTIGYRGLRDSIHPRRIDLISVGAYPRSARFGARSKMRHWLELLHLEKTGSTTFTYFRLRRDAA